MLECWEGCGDCARVLGRLCQSAVGFTMQFVILPWLLVFCQPAHAKVGEQWSTGQYSRVHTVQWEGPVKDSTTVISEK